MEETKSIVIPSKIQDTDWFNSPRVFNGNQFYSYLHIGLLSPRTVRQEVLRCWDSQFVVGLCDNAKKLIGYFLGGIVYFRASGVGTIHWGSVLGVETSLLRKCVLGGYG